MHYKIASFILNASKHQTGSREVYIAQPDSQKEGLAGKIFFVAEIGGKKTEAKAAIDFILDSINRYYYEDEKIFLQDKVEGLTLENIFEAAVAKINKALSDFLNAEKIFLQPDESSITLGLIFEDKLYFTNFGRNKAFLIYEQDESYELINVETSATEVPVSESGDTSLNPKFFSSVISGSVPPASYFLFSNDVLAEYLSNKELINIITKLPPMVAAEQIKATLAKLNSYVPFLGIIIKNTFGLSLSELKEDVQAEAQKSAHNSISHLNSTEARTEKMLAPTGLFNFKKLSNLYQQLTKRKLRPVDRQEQKSEIDQEIRTKSLKNSQIRTNSNLIKDKIFFGRSQSKFSNVFKAIFKTVINIFNPNFWSNILRVTKKGFSNLHPRNKGIFFLLIAIVLLLFFSLSTTRSNNRKKAQDLAFTESIASLESRKDQLEPYLLYDNLEGAKTLIGDILLSLDEISFRTSEQEEKINNLRAEVLLSKAKVQKLVTINDPELVYNYQDYNASAETRNIVIRDDIIYAADPLAKAVYVYNTKDNEADSILLSGEIASLDHPLLYEDKIYYLNDKSLISLDKDGDKVSRFSIQGFGADDRFDDFAFFGSNLYTLSASNNQIYKLTKQGSNYLNRSNWLKNEASLGNSVSMAVTGDILILKNDGKLDKFRSGLSQEFSLTGIDPNLDSASILKYLNDKLYILDRNSKRLIVFELDASLRQQYVFPGLNNIKDFTVANDYKHAYILNDDSVYKIDLE